MRAQAPKAVSHGQINSPPLADAATDYLLFSLRKGRWTPQK